LCSPDPNIEIQYFSLSVSHSAHTAGQARQRQWVRLGQCTMRRRGSSKCALRSRRNQHTPKNQSILVSSQCPLARGMKYVLRRNRAMGGVFREYTSTNDWKVMKILIYSSRSVLGKRKLLLHHYYQNCQEN
jgi:hypothetical protein